MCKIILKRNGLYLFIRIGVFLFRTGKPGVQGPVTPQRQDDPQDDTWYSIFPVENDELVYGTWEDEASLNE